MFGLFSNHSWLQLPLLVQDENPFVQISITNCFLRVTGLLFSSAQAWLTAWLKEKSWFLALQHQWNAAVELWKWFTITLNESHQNTTLFFSAKCRRFRIFAMQHWEHKVCFRTVSADDCDYHTWAQSTNTWAALQFSGGIPAVELHAVSDCLNHT